MDVVERLTLEAAQADTMLACEHRHRYEFARALCGDLRVLDLCCGSGYGTRILAATALEVVGVDIDAATVETAQVTVGRDLDNVGFDLGDAVEYVGRNAGRFDAVVCFEGLEHLQGLEQALEQLRAQAQGGLRIVASVPNDQLFEERNPFHVTAFGYDSALRAFASFPNAVMVPQFLAEGSLICPSGAVETEVAVTLEDRDEPEYANHFIFCVNFDPAEVQRAHRGRIQLNTSPVFNRWSEDLKRGAWALARENARLARARLGKGGSAAAAALARIEGHEAQVAALEQRWRHAQARIVELEAELLAAAPIDDEDQPGPEGGLPRGQARAVHADTASSSAPAGWAEVIEASPRRLAPEEHPNSWEQRRRRAADVLIPWIEQTLPLTGTTVLEYGCGNAAVTSAVAERAGRVIGVDIDPDGLDLGERELRRLGITNVELELHPLESILDAVARRRGEIDVFLLYAVLEHLTLEERLAVLRLARQVVKPDGAIVVCETPNRLIYFDHHTAQMPFFHLLPDELAARYYDRSQRQDFKSAIAAAAQAGGEDARLQAVVRWGRGVSFHEFELVFSDLSRHVIASSYEPILFSERPVHPDEVVLARYLDRVRPDLAPSWSRYWLDVILSPQELDQRPAFLRPWTADTTQSEGIAWTRWENMRIRDAGATLWVTLPHPTRRLVIGAVTEDGRSLILRARPQTATDPVAAELEPPARVAGFASFTFADPAQRIGVGASAACHLVFVGYEA